MSIRMFFGRSVAASLSVSLSGGGDGTLTNSPPALSPNSAYVNTFPDTVATASGGTPPYTYAWTRISGSAAISALSPSSSITLFGGTVPFGTTAATFRMTVSDSAGGSATADLPVTLTYENGF